MFSLIIQKLSTPKNAGRYKSALRFSNFDQISQFKNNDLHFSREFDKKLLFEYIWLPEMRCEQRPST